MIFLQTFPKFKTLNREMTIKQKFTAAHYRHFTVQSWAGHISLCSRFQFHKMRINICKGLREVLGTK